MNKPSFSAKTLAIIGLIIVTSSMATSILNTSALPNFPEEWRLIIAGSVEQPMNLTLNDLAAMPQTTVQATIYCVDFPTVIVETGNWKGVALPTLLEQAEVLPSAMKVAFYAADGYASDLDLQTAISQNVIVAYEKDGALLSETLRLVVPGKWGYKWVSQLTQIALVDYDFKGKWESQGYSDDATVQASTNRPTPSTVPSFPNPDQSSEPAPPSSNPQPSNSSTTLPPQDTENPSPEPELPALNSLPMVWIIAAVSIIIAAVLLIVYKKKRHLNTFFHKPSASKLFAKKLR